MMNKAITVTIIVMLFAFLTAYADERSGGRNLFRLEHKGWSPARNPSAMTLKVAGRLVSPADELYSHSFGVSKQPNILHESGSQFCNTDNTAVVTIYTTNGMAKKEVDVKLDGSAVGSLATYFPDGGPPCRTPSAKGIITISVPAGEHILEAESPNMSWPIHRFSVEKCGCIVLPLS